MIKTITVFKNIGNVVALQKFFVEEVFPHIHSLPGVICTDITSVHHVSQDISGELVGLQLIMETHFESEEAMQRLVFSEQGNSLMARSREVTPCEISFFLGQEKRFSSELTNNLRQTMARIGYEE